MERSADATDEFGLGLGGKLIVQASECTLLGTERIVDLYVSRDETVRSELFLAEGTSKEPSVVTPLLQIDQEGAGNGCLSKNHDFLGSIEQVEPMLKRSESDELVSLEILLGKAVFNHFTV
jgi:hypothetical protein